MFRGFSHHNIDTKGRLIIPSRFKDLIHDGDQAGVMMSKLDGCLVAFPYQKWQEIEGKILSQAKKDDRMRRFRRVFLGGAFDCKSDRQDRIVIPPPLRDYAGLEKEVVLVGVLDHFEIWSRLRWDAENEELEIDMKQEDFKQIIAGLDL